MTDRSETTDDGVVPGKGDSSDVYRMTVDLNVLDHLGINLYSNIAAVLTEAVANAWDADAARAEIRIGPKGKWISITDDGIGMTVNDMNQKYLRVGYRRRDEDLDYGRRTAKGRPVMGRKGLGKLSLFSIANTIEVQSAREGKAHGLRMTIEGIRQSVAKKEPHYTPEPLLKSEITVLEGTSIRLEHIKRQRLGPGTTALRKRLARRFSVIGESHGFAILIDGNPVKVSDRGDLAIVQFMWAFGEHDIDLSATANLKESTSLPSRLSGWPEDWHVTGWLGTARLPKQLDSEDAGNLNGIVVFARGRLFHENILDKLNDGRLYTKYLTGQIEADFLDNDDEPDIATSDRQRLQEDDHRYIALIEFLKKSVNALEKQWNEWRRKHELKKAKEVAPALGEWLAGLPDGHRKSAEAMIANLSAVQVDDDSDRRVLYRHGILAFERMKIRGFADQLANGIVDVESLLPILADRDALEASLYRDIVRSRLDAIKTFHSLVDDNARERALQEYLFDQLWLLDPAWERAAGSEIMETRLKAEGVIVDDLSEKEKLGRVDIAYRTTAGKHIIVELKRAGRKMKLLELVEQGQMYVDKTRRILAAQGVSSPNIEVIFVLGRPVDEEMSDPDRLKASMTSISPGSRIVHYDTLIRGAQEAYAEYLTASAALDKLEKIVDQI